MRQQVKKLMLGNGLAQALQFGSILILSRIYAPSDFGYLAQVQSIAMIGAVWITLQLHLTIPLQKTSEEARQAIKIIEKLALSFFLLAIIPSLLIGELFVYVILLSLFLGLANTYNGYLVYSGKFGQLSGFYIVRAFLIIIMQITFSIIDFENGLVLATLIGEVFAAIYLRKIHIEPLKSVGATFGQVLKYIKNNKAFSIYGSIHETISVGAFFVPLFLFSYKFGEDVGGQYAMANRLVWAPIVLLSSSFAQVYYHKIGQVEHISSIKVIDKNNFKIVVVGLTAVLTTFFMVDLFHLFLGNEWRMASELLPIQLLWGFFFLLSTPFRVIARVAKMQRLQILIDVVFIIVVVNYSFLANVGVLSLMAFILMAAFLQHASICYFVHKKLLKKGGV